MNLRKSFVKLGCFLKPQFLFNVQTILAVPIALVLIFCIILQGFFFFIVRLTGRLVEKWSYSKKVRKVLYDMRKAKDFKTYQVCTKQLDVMTNREEWKFTDDPPTCGGHVNYDANLLKKKNRNMEQLIQDNDFVGMAATIKSICDSNMYNTFNTAFYSMTFNGTKQTIQEFHFLVKKCIDILSENIHLDSTSFISKFPSDTIDYLQRCSKEYGNTCLILSGGAMLGLHHFGLIEVLLNEKCLPKIIAGTSAGSVAAAFICTRTDEEILSYIQDKEKMNIFLSPFVPNNWWNRFYNYLSHGCTIQIEYWRNLGFSIFGDITFLEAYKLTGRVLNITTSQVGGQGGSFILHYKNAPHFLISTAVLASSSFPYMCCPVQLYEKDPVTRTIAVAKEFSDSYFNDGSLQLDVPSSMIRSTWNVKYIVVSQVNIHVFPFLELRTHGSPGCPVRGWSSLTVWRGGFVLGLLEVLLKEHLRFLIRSLALSEVLPSINGINMANLTLQPYGGDLNVFPSRIALPHAFVMNNVPSVHFDWYIQAGRTMIFPKLSILRTRLGFENGLKTLEHISKSVCRIPAKIFPPLPVLVS